MFPHYPDENGLGFVPGSFHWIKFESGPHTHTHTDNWTTYAMNVVTLCMAVFVGEQRFCAHGRFTISVVLGLTMRDAQPFVVGSTMLLSVCMPHSGRDEEDYIEALETVRATLTEWKKAGAADFIGSDQTVEMILCTVISVSQLSVYGAVPEMCEELAWEVAKCSKDTEKSVAPENLETMVTPPEVSTTVLRPMQENRENLLLEYEQKFANLPEHF